MSKTKKIISLLLAVLLVMTMATVAIVSSSALEEGEFHVVAGSSGLCGSDWDPADTNNLMTWNADKGIYEKIYTNVAAGTYEFKVTTDGAWDNPEFNLEGSANGGGANAVANVTVSGSTVTIGYDGFKALLDITSEPVEPGDDPTDAPTDAPVDDPTEAPVVDGETITIYFENNWMWPEVSLYYWAGENNNGWPGQVMTECVGKNGDGTYDIYKMEVPANIEGIVFSGNGEYGLDQSADVTDIQDGYVYYMTYDESTGTKPCGSYPYEPANTDPTDPTDVPTDPTDAPTDPTDPTDAPTDPTDAPTDPVVEKGVSVDGTLTPVTVGDTITYTATIKADELFENIQAQVNYDADKLEVIVPERSTEACPNIANGLVFNAKNAGVVKFNASAIDGYDFKEGLVLITLQFNVKDDTLSEIELFIEEMTIVGDGTQSYFSGGEAVITDGFAKTEELDAPPVPTPGTDPEPTPGTDPEPTPGTDPEPTPGTDPVVEKGVKVNDDVTAVTVGDEITYTVYLTAEELFEDVQAIITYDADKLELVEAKGTEACPGLANGLTFNAKTPGEVKFNAVYLEGYDFTNEGVFVTLKFNVKDDTLSEIDLVIEEMTMLTGDSYFTDGEPSVTDGITVREVLEAPEQPTTVPPTTTGTTPTEPSTPGSTSTDPTGTAGTTATGTPSTPNTGASAYIYVALAIVAMAAAAVVVLRKKANG